MSIGKRSFQSAIALTRSDVFPEPGLETRLSAKTPASSSWALLVRAKASFLERMSRSNRMMRASCLRGMWAPARFAPKIYGRIDTADVVVLAAIIALGVSMPSTADTDCGHHSTSNSITRSSSPVVIRT
jgi:hypothetical protein